MTACTQPGCTGTIIDGYCDVCGSPAGAAAFVPAGSAASAAAAPADKPGLTAVPREQVDSEKVGPAADNAGKVAGEKELAEHDGAEEYRRRVEEAQLPGDVREAALREVGKLERTSDQSPESGDIRNWLDTILALPWSTTTPDWIDLQESGEVEATLRKLIEPEVADTEEVDAAEVEPVAGDAEEGYAAEVEPVAGDAEEGDATQVEPTAASLEKSETATVHPAAPADTEKVDRAPADPPDDDSVDTAAVVAVPSANGHPGSNPPEQQVVGPVLVETPAKKGRFGSLAVAVAALVALLIGGLFFASSRQGSATGQSPPTVTGTPAATVSKPTIQLVDVADSGRPFQPVRIQGVYHGGPNTFLQTQREEAGNWVDFPLHTKTDHMGKFTTYVELPQPGRYRLQVLDPNSGVTSETFVVLVKG